MRVTIQPDGLTTIDPAAGDLLHAPLVDLDNGRWRLLTRGTIFLDDAPLEPEALDLDRIAAEGIETLAARLDGRFWLILLEHDSRRAHLLSDPFSTLPLLVVRRAGTIHVTDDARTAAALSDGAIDRDTVALLLTSGYPVGGRTLHADTRRLAPGHILTLEPGRADRVRDYVGAERSASPGYRDADDLLGDIDASIGRCRRAGRPIRLPLSGGVDSRLLACRLAASSDVEAFTWTGNKPAGAPDDDAGGGEAVARALGLPHRAWRWSPDGFPDGADAFIARTGGLSANFQQWPQGDGFLATMTGALVLRGDETFGWKSTVGDLAGALSQLQIYPFHDERLRVFPDVVGLLEETHPLPEPAAGPAIDAWKQRVYREVRVVNMLSNGVLALSGHAHVESPFLARRIVARLANTAPDLTSDKRLARQALDRAAPETLRRLPIATAPLFRPPGRFLELWRRHRESITETLLTPSPLHDLVNVRLYLHDLDGHELVHNLRRGGGAPVSTAIQRYLARLTPSLQGADWFPGFTGFLKLNANRPAHQAVPHLYAMQRFLLMIGSGDAPDAQA